MQAWEEKIIDRQMGKAEGKIEDILELLQELGPVTKELQERIISEKDLSVLSSWVKVAARSESIVDFRTKAEI